MISVRRHYYGHEHDLAVDITAKSQSIVFRRSTATSTSEYATTDTDTFGDPIRPDPTIPAGNEYEMEEFSERAGF